MPFLYNTNCSSHYGNLCQPPESHGCTSPAGFLSLLFHLCSPLKSKPHLGILPVEQLFLCDIGIHRRWGALRGPNSDKKFLQSLFYYGSTLLSSQVRLRQHNKHNMSPCSVYKHTSKFTPTLVTTCVCYTVLQGKE